MPHTPLPRRLWLQFLRQSLSGQLQQHADSGQILDLATAFCRCRALALFTSSGGERFKVGATSAALGGSRAELQSILGAGADGAGLITMAAAAPAASWPLVDIADSELLVPLRGLALRLECQAVSLHTAEGEDASEGFLLALWEDENPAPTHLDRAQLAATALGNVLPEAAARQRLETRADAPRAEARGARRAGDAARVQARVLLDLEELSRSADSLAALAPHSRLLRDLDTEVAEATRRGEPLALVLIDADDLAAVNREHGPQAGDQLLREIAAILTEDAGTKDLVVRYGAEEFALLVHGGGPDRIRHMALEIQQRVEARALPGPSGSRHGSVSVGAACFPDSLAPDGQALRLKAEQALDLARQRRPGGLIIL